MQVSVDHKENCKFSLGHSFDPRHAPAAVAILLKPHTRRHRPPNKDL